MSAPRCSAAAQKGSSRSSSSSMSFTRVAISTPRMPIERILELSGGQLRKPSARLSPRPDKTVGVIPAHVGDERVGGHDDLLGDVALGPVAEVRHVADDLHVDALAVHRLESHVDAVEGSPIARLHQMLVVRVRRSLMVGGELDQSRRKGVCVYVYGGGRIRRHGAMLAGLVTGAKQVEPTS